MFTKQLHIAAYTLVDQLQFLPTKELQKICNFTLPEEYQLKISKKIKIDIKSNTIQFKLKIISNKKILKCIFTERDNVCLIQIN
jgi:hypothetical protein